MGVRVGNSLAALFAERQTGLAAGRLNRTLTQLGSGVRIGRAADDAAGLAIAERFRAEIRGLNQEINNIQTGINLTQTAEGGLSVQADAVGRIRELATRAASGLLTAEQRLELNEEAQQLLEQIENTAQNTEFNGTDLLNGTTNTVQLDGEGEVQVNLNESTTSSLGIDSVDISTAAGAQDAISALDTATARISQNRASVGAQQNRLRNAVEVRDQQALDQQAAESQIRDLDLARAVVARTRDQILLQSGVSAIAQGNLQNQTALRLLGG